MTKQLPQFLYLSQIIKLPVIEENTRRRIGCVDDIVVDLGEMYPRVCALFIRYQWSRKADCYSWSAVKQIVESKHLILTGDYASKLNGALKDNKIRLKETLLDKQIVDISGSKVERVNDIHLLRDDLKLWVVHVDVGFKGILRRLGWLKFFNGLIRWIFSYEMKDKYISWKYVQPVSTQVKFSPLSLKVPHSKLSELHPADLADILIDLGIEERMVIFNSLDTETAAETLAELPMKLRVQVSEMLERGKLAAISNEMPMDELADLVAEMRSEIVIELYRTLPEDIVAQVKDLLTHSKHSAGSIMNTEFISVPQHMSVLQVLKRIKKNAEDIESIYYVYILNEDDILEGIVTLKQLLVSPRNARMADLMRKKVVRVDVDETIKKVAQIFFKYNFMVVPVVDENGRLTGIITIKDALESFFPEIREETEEIT